MRSQLARRVVVGAVVLGSGALGVDASAVEVFVSADADNTMYEEDGALSNGVGDHFFAGQNNGGNNRRGLVRFDIASSIPSGATINTATLSLYMSRTTAGDVDIDLLRLLAPWGEGASNAPGNEGGGAPAQAGDATWIFSNYLTTNWTTPGGDFTAALSGTSLVGPVGFYAWTDAGLAADVQAWLDTPGSNFGWLVDAPFATGGESKRFDSRQNPTGAQRPLLSVDFDLLTPSGACCAIDGACTIVDDPGGGCAGTYQGLSTLCNPNPCPEPIGACCLPTADGACVADTPSACAAQTGSFQGALSTCIPDLCPVVLTPYLDELPIPPIATPVNGVAGGAADYVIAARQTQLQLHAELPDTTVVWAYDDGVSGPSFPGPTIEAFSNELVTVDWVNDLRDEFNVLRTDHYLNVDMCPHGAELVPHTVVHLHGAHTAADWDGYPEDHYPPGNSLLFQYPNAQDGSSLWYHDHSLGSTRLNVYMGLAGFFLIRDTNEQNLGLPSGPFDIPLALMDRQFNTDGSLSYPDNFSPTFLGDHILVNGKVWPFANVLQGKYRFRILNASGTRAYNLALSDGAQFDQIGTDGGLLNAPIPMNSILVTPGERVEIVVDFAGYAPGTMVELVNSAPSPFPGTPGVGVVPEVMQFRVQNQPGYTGNLPTNLRFIQPLMEIDTAQSRDFLLDGEFDPCTGANMFMINGLGWMDITEVPQLGTTEVWRFINNTSMTHPMHLHLDFMQMLDKTPFTMVGGVPVATGPAVPPAPYETGWQDTVQVDPGEMVRVIAQFDDFVGRFAYHCHILEHEDHEMMRQFETVTTCGDGATGFPVEQCDDAGESTFCDGDCTFVLCGDGTTNLTAGEACDDSGESVNCNANCTLALCGDGLINAAAGEDCDDSGESPTCNANCTNSACGDGILNFAANEDCDDGGESPTCNIDCTDAFCGDTVVNATAAEECDDGTETAACDYDCTLTECGDGDINFTANEECDDGGESPGCDADCSYSDCGDAVMNASAGEECDDGGDSERCDGDCTLPECGDGYTNLEAEECDADGESSDCDVDCTFAECGDGVINGAANEFCDDGNTTPGDGCDAGCQVEEGAGGGGVGGDGDGDGDGAGASGDGSGGGVDADGPGGGCGCRIEEPAAGGRGAVLVGLLWLAAMRRRRRGTTKCISV